jgi:hypothetical protein
MLTRLDISQKLEVMSRLLEIIYNAVHTISNTPRSAGANGLTLIDITPLHIMVSVIMFTSWHQ